ncbi:pentapeptide repeat-containing protein [Streptomyces echinatus]|uniref:pentapeptide repeat-containing protein n=1 Tax=Streptomyces echinatus TaxID=67293 RepID=UPI0037AA0E7E
MSTRWWRRKSWMWGILTALGGFGAVVLALWQVPWWLDAKYLPAITQPQATAVTGVRTALLAVGAGSLAAVGILYTHRTLHQNREGQVTDRYTKAIGQLASDKPVEQLGGIYALERIMRDSVKDHATIVEVLAAFVREHAPAPAEPSTPRWLAHHLWRVARTRVPPLSTALQRGRFKGTSLAVLLHKRTVEQTSDRLRTGTDRRQTEGELRPSEAVQAALTVLGRRPQGRDEPFRLNLRHTKLSRAELTGAHLEKADLTGAVLGNADLRFAHLEGALLVGARLKRTALVRAHLEEAGLAGAHLEEADLRWAHLGRASLRYSHLERADLTGAHVEGADLTGAHLEGADLTKAHLEGAKLTEAHLNGAGLTKAHLEGAELTGAHLEGANLTEAHLEKANLKWTHLEGAYLDLVRLDAAHDLTVEQLVSARPRQNASLPAHLAADPRVVARIDAVEEEDGLGEHRYSGWR